MKTILITGGTGLVGTRLTELLLEREYNVVLVSRNCALQNNAIFQELQKQYPGQLSCSNWNPELRQIDAEAIKQADAIINLAGENIAEKRWTEKRKKELMESRVFSGETICQALRDIPNHVEVVVSASAIGWYGEDNDRPDLTPFKEDAQSANDFIAQVCFNWEKSVQPVKELGKRLVILRTGIVLSNHGGFLPKIQKSLNFRIASILGNGHQILSWIHIDDLCDMYISAIEMEELTGVYNAVVPFSITYQRFIKTLAEKQYKQSYLQFPIPKTVLQMTLGDMSKELIKSCLVSSKKILDTGFSFQYPRIKDAINDLVR